MKGNSRSLMAFRQFQSFCASINVSRRCPNPISLVDVAKRFIEAQLLSTSSPQVRPTFFVQLNENLSAQPSIWAAKWNFGTNQIISKSLLVTFFTSVSVSNGQSGWLTRLRKWMWYLQAISYDTTTRLIPSDMSRLRTCVSGKSKLTNLEVKLCEYLSP